MPKTKKPKRILVTSALPYANGPIHIGHLVEYIQTDIFVRFLKLIGEDAIYCCAEDTHGTPIAIKAQAEGILPEELIERFYKEHLEDFTSFLIHFDSYYSTNSEENRQFCEMIFNKLKEKGLIYRKDVDLAYCEKCKRFLPDRYVKGKCPKCKTPDQYGDVCENCRSTYETTDLVDPYCTICGGTPERRVSNHYFFKLSACSEKLEKWLNKNKKLQPEIRNYVMNWIKEGLQDWDISRDGPYFGFKIPGEDDMYFYVWLDAPIGYISSTANYCKGYNLDPLKDYWQSKDSQIIHVIGKDIIYFHYLFWPAILMEAGLNLPDYLVTHGFLTVNGAKMSKSRGTFFTAKDFIEKFEPEYLRYYYANLLSKKMMDIDFNFEEFRDKVNNELVGNMANFCFRVLSFTKKNFDSKIGKIESNKKLEKEILAKAEKAKKAYADFNFKEAIKEILAISALGNKHFQESEPWKKIKDDKVKAHKTVGLCLNIVKILSIVLAPMLPRFSEQLQKQLNLKKLIWNDINFDFSDQDIGEPAPLVKKIEEIPTKEPVAKEFKEIEIEVEPEVKELGINAVSVCIQGVKIKKKHEGLEKLKKKYLPEIDFKENILGEYENLYKKVGVKQVCPLRALIKSIKEGGKIPQINTVVDSYNIVAAKYNLSVGCHDIHKLAGTPRLIIAKGTEKFTALGRPKAETLKKGIFSCVDAKRVICYLDVKQCEQTKVDNSTENIFIYVQGNKETPIEYLQKALNEICNNIIKFCGGKYELVGPGKPFPANLKVAKILEAKPHPEAEKLIVMQIDLKTEKRQIIAGIKELYDPKDIVGRTIIVVTNLKPAKLRGLESRGMLLVGMKDKKNFVLLDAPESEAGDQVLIDDYEMNTQQISIEEFAKIKLKIKDKKVWFGHHALHTDKEEILADIEDGAKVE